MLHLKRVLENENEPSNKKRKLKYNEKWTQNYKSYKVQPLSIGGGNGYYDRTTRNTQQLMQPQKKKNDRIFVNNTIYTGVISTFSNGKFGWIEPSISLQETGVPLAHLNRGKVWFHKKDMLRGEDLTTVKEGAKIQFLIYADERGLGAHQCMILSGDKDADEKRHAKLIIRQMQPPEMSFTIQLLVENILLGSIIGKKGVQLRKFHDESGGADISILSSSNPTAKENDRSSHHYRLGSSIVEVSGTCDQLKSVLKSLATHIAVHAQNVFSKLIFLVPEWQTGGIIGKKGATFRKIKGENTNMVMLVEKEPYPAEEQDLNKIVMFGPVEDFKKSVDMMTLILTQLQQNAVYRRRNQRSKGAYNALSQMNQMSQMGQMSQMNQMNFQ